MGKIPYFQSKVMSSKSGNLKKREQLVIEVLEALKDANFKDEDVKEYLIKAFQDIKDGKDKLKALALESNESGQFSKIDYDLVINVGQRIEELFDIKIEGKTKNRARHPSLSYCCATAANEFSITDHEADKFYKYYKKALKENNSIR